MCPAEPAFGGAACCVVSERDSSTMGGEFFRLPSGSHLEPVLEGAPWPRKGPKRVLDAHRARRWPRERNRGC